MDLLRFTTAGSVDDGKSTLIGRLLYDSKSIFQDQLDAIELTCRNNGEETVNLALLTDGLRAETGTKDHHRRGIQVFRHPEAQVYHRRHARDIFNTPATW
jgi:sulfate adenylyltransferase subunit 1 (EFTu-like GTPase family)